MREQSTRYRNLGKLERDVAAMADHLRTDLDQLCTKRDQLPLRVNCRRRRGTIRCLSGRALWATPLVAVRLLHRDR